MVRADIFSVLWQFLNFKRMCTILKIVRTFFAAGSEGKPPRLGKNFFIQSPANF